MRTPKIKLQPPRRPEAYVWRPRLERLLDSANERRLTIVVAGPGYGKSTLVATKAVEHGWVWYGAHSDDASVHVFARGLRDALVAHVPALADGIPDEAFAAETEGLASSFTQALEDVLERDVVLVVDDVHELEQRSSSALFLEAVSRQSPAELHLVLATREEPPFPTERMQGRGQALRIDSSALAFTAEEVEVLLLDVGAELADDAADLFEATGGWPAAVQLAAQVLATAPADERAEPLLALKRRSSPLFAYLAEEVLRHEPPDVLELLRVIAALDRFAPELCAELGLPDPDEKLAHLRRRGFVITGRDTAESLSLHPLLRDFVREGWPLDDEERRAVHRLTARWAEANGLLGEALASWREAEEPLEIVRLFVERREELVDGGHITAVVAAASTVPDELMTVEARMLLTSCYGIQGDQEAELRNLQLLAATGERPDWVSFHVGNAHLSQGRHREAIESFLSAESAHLPMHLVFAAYVYLELDQSRRYALLGLEGAREAGHITAEAEARNGLGSIAMEEGDLSTAETQCAAGLEAALRAGNVLAECSSRIRIAQLRILQGRYSDALATIDETLLLAGRIGFALFFAWALLIRGWVHERLGRLDEALADMSLSVERYRRLGAPGRGIVNLGDTHLERGDLIQARSAYETAFGVAEDSRNPLLRASSLSGLARVRVGEDPVQAIELADQAVEAAPGQQLEFLLTRGWICFAVGDRTRATADSAAALAAARRQGDRLWLAEALELRAAAEADGQPSLEEALAIWQELESPIPVARVELALAVDSGAVAEASRARRKLRRLGVRDGAFRAAGPLFRLAEKEAQPLAIHTLGGFKVLRTGEEVPAAEWKSKKARDLVKVLVSARGRPLTREQLIEALWPEEPTDRTGNRLSVALSTVRATLDPGKDFDAGHFIEAEEGRVRIRLDRVVVDAEAFLHEADAALATWRTEQTGEARALLEEAESSYAGDFLPEDLYESWSSSLREQARVTYVELVRALAEAAEGREATRYYLRVLEADPYDEQAHLGLVTALSRSGAHGEARRAYGNYVGQMAVIGVEPVPLADLMKR